MRVRLQFFLLGLLVGMWLARRWYASAETLTPVSELPGPAPRIEAPKAAAASEAPRPALVERSEPDPLTEIKGIGPTFEHALRQIGITTFAQLASQEPESLADKLGGRVSSERIRRENWIPQARERAQGTE